ncbi:hypothetical protein HAX54_027057 [Datura stramonium]|uniref:Uncharacterized protein n=1 Tax=Datura stramonium TaxID=4076 RepID=A0ABS8S8F5_DATST|nr:hypothetical protein [Datura stramonium]
MLEVCEFVAKRGGIGVQSMISGLIEAQRHGTEEINRLTMFLTQRKTDLALLRAEQTSGEPGAMLALQNENALLKDENTALKKQLEDLTQNQLKENCYRLLGYPSDFKSKEKKNQPDQSTGHRPHTNPSRQSTNYKNYDIM